MIQFRRITAVNAAWLLSLSSWPAFAIGVDSAIGQYQDDISSSLLLSVSGDYQADLFFNDPSKLTGVRAGYSGRQISYDGSAPIVRESLKGKTSVMEHSMSLSGDQAFSARTQVGLFAGATESPLAQSRWFGVRGGQWFLRDTIQLTSEVRSTSASQEPLTGVDADGTRIRLPENLSGFNVGIGIMQFATPTTIWRGNYSRTTRSDRPDADSISAEVRQFVTPTLSAVHIGASYFRNSGEVRPTTFIGSVNSHSLSVEWHQRLPGRVIAMGGYRYYRESETPRVEQLGIKLFGSDYINGSVRWRLGATPWHVATDELYTFFGLYRTNEPSNGRLIGLGAKLIL